MAKINFFHLNLQKTLPFLLLIIFCANPMAAQNINLGMKTGWLFPKVKVANVKDLSDRSRTSVGHINTIFVEGRFKKRFYVGIEMGTCSYSKSLDLNYRTVIELGTLPSYSVYHHYNADYQQEQFYFSISPQIKFGKSEWLSFGGGVGLYRNFINRLESGYSKSFIDPQNSTVFIENFNGQNLHAANTVTGAHLNLTLNPRLNKHLGLIFEAKYIWNSTSSSVLAENKPFLYFNSFATTFGLSFHF